MYPYRLLICIVLCLIFNIMPAQAQTEKPSSEQEPQVEQPSLELLEFLGSFETQDGQFLDPTELDDLPVSTEEASDEE